MRKGWIPSSPPQGLLQGGAAWAPRGSPPAPLPAPAFQAGIHWMGCGGGDGGGAGCIRGFLAKVRS